MEKDLYPWRRIARTAFQLVLALAVLLIAIADELTASFPQLAPYIAGAVAVALAVTRLMALPAVEEFLESWLPWLAAEPPSTDAQDGGV